jgi:hypothetical protein
MATKLRNLEIFDMPFVYNSWLRSFQPRGIESIVYFTEYHALIKKLLAGMGKGLVAVAEDAPDVILAYCIYSDQTVHYVYTKESLRRCRLATQLLAALPPSVHQYSHYTTYGEKLRQSLPTPHPTFNPYSFFTEALK